MSTLTHLWVVSREQPAATSVNPLQAMARNPFEARRLDPDHRAVGQESHREHMPIPDMKVRRQTVAWTYGLACHALFALGVGSMMVVMFGGMTASLGGVPPPARPVVNGLLLLQFPILHSWLLTRAGARMLVRLAPAGFGPVLATTVYGAIASTQVALLFLGWSFSGVVWWTAQGPGLVVLSGLYAASWLLLGKAILDAGLAYQVGMLGWKALAADKPVLYPAMPTQGLFRVCRQPIYVAFALTLWTVPVWTPDQLTVAVALTLYCLAGPLLKERRFARRFGPAFRRYQGAVPYWLPWPRPGRQQ